MLFISVVQEWLMGIWMNNKIHSLKMQFFFSLKLFFFILLGIKWNIKLNIVKRCGIFCEDFSIYLHKFNSVLEVKGLFSYPTEWKACRAGIEPAIFGLMCQLCYNGRFGPSLIRESIFASLISEPGISGLCKWNPGILQTRIFPILLLFSSITVIFYKWQFT